MLPNVKLGFSTQKRLVNTLWLIGGILLLANSFYPYWFINTYGWQDEFSGMPGWQEGLFYPSFILMCITGGALALAALFGIVYLIMNWKESLPYDD
ncbi:hypothetical protein SEA_KEELAN_88 [Gordonia phage Keelan]|nr:hypothetical protein SEA_KEELAN_88 [Gordonia phage Keelan]